MRDLEISLVSFDLLGNAGHLSILPFCPDLKRNMHRAKSKPTTRVYPSTADSHCPEEQHTSRIQLDISLV